jgi:hypothetical protein
MARGILELPFPLDLRYQAPPLGYRPEEVPVLDVDNLYLDAQRILKDDGALSDVFVIPGQPAYLLREQSIGYESTVEALNKLIEAGNNSFAWFENEGIEIPSHRHIGGELARTTASGNPIEGCLFTLCRRLPSSYETLNPMRPDHLAGSLFVLQTAHKYLSTRMGDRAASSEILDDCFGADQYSIDAQTGRVALHDTDLYIKDGRQSIEDGEEWVVEQCVGTLDFFAATAVKGAQGTLYLSAALSIRERIKADLPNPNYSNEEYVPPTLEEQRELLD